VAGFSRSPVGGNTGKIRKLFFSVSMALEDKATVLRRNLSAADRQQTIRTEKFGAEIEKLGEMARRLRAKLETCYVKLKRCTVSVAAEERKNPEFGKRPGGLERCEGRRLRTQ
jgi:hypothetical protein